MPVLTIIDTLGGDLGRVPFIGGIVQFIFAGWLLATHTTDRAGLLVVHDLNHVYSTLVKLVIGPTLYLRRPWRPGRTGAQPGWPPPRGSHPLVRQPFRQHTHGPL